MVKDQFFPYYLLLTAIIFLTTVPAHSQSAIELARLSPATINVATGATVITKLSDDSLPISLTYRWFLNGEENFFQTSEHYPGSQLKRGDTVSVEVIPAIYGGQPLEPYTLGPQTVENAPPVIEAESAGDITERKYVYQVTASDPDKDRLKYELEQAPPGMIINPHTGLIEWFFKTIPEGEFFVKVVVSDGAGGRAFQTFELSFAHSTSKKQK